MTERAVQWDKLPLFASDKEIGEVLLGPKRAGEFQHQAALLEGKSGFPSIDHRFGGRYVPALEAYFNWEYGLTEKPPMKINGVEGSWKNPEKSSAPMRHLQRRA